MHEVTMQNASEVVKAVKEGRLPGPAASLAEAMARVMEQVGYVQKSKQMEFGQKYRYAGEADFIAALRPELVKQQIVIAPVAMEMIGMETVKSQKGGEQNRVVIKVAFRFTHAPTGQFLDVVTCGEGIDSGDKATNKAMTGAMKYALRQAFVIETGNDPDDTPSQQQERKVEPKPDAVKTQTDYYAAMLANVDSRGALLKAYRTYEADVKSGKVPAEARPAVDKLFKECGAKFPKPKEDSPTKA